MCQQSCSSLASAHAGTIAPPLPGPERGAAADETIPSGRFGRVQVCPGDEGLPMARDTLARAVCCCQPWSRPHSLQIQMSKAVNKSTLWSRCYFCPSGWLLFCWAPGEAKGSQRLENKLCSTAGWALRHCRCSFHNSPEVRRARRGRRERGAQQAEGEHGHKTQPAAALWQGRAGHPLACA